MKTKAEVIREEWEQSEAPFLEYNIDNGWSVRHDIKPKEVNFDKFQWVCNLDGYKIRPKSLQGIEDNNGWISIKSEEDLPEDSKECFYLLGDTIFVAFGCDVKRHYRRGKLKHYQPITKPNPPLHD